MAGQEGAGEGRGRGRGSGAGFRGRVQGQGSAMTTPGFKSLWRFNRRRSLLRHASPRREEANEANEAQVLIK